MKKLSLLVLMLASSAAVAATPSEGVELKVRRGFFTETSLGAFFTVGGDNGYSNLQSYVQLGAGYNIGAVELGFHVGLGTNAANCWSGLDAKGLCTATDNFTLTFLNLSGAYMFEVASRLFLGPKVKAGWTLLEPAPIATTRGGAGIGLGVALEYAVYLDHLAIGLEAMGGMVVGPNIPTIEIYPRLKYTF